MRNLNNMQTGHPPQQTEVMNLELFLYPVTKNLRFYTFILLLGCICTVCVLWNGSRLAGLAELWLDLYCLCVILTLIPKKARGAARAIIAFLLYAIAIIDLGLYYTCGYPIIPQAVLLFLQTNTSEAGEAFTTYADASLLLTPWSLVVLLSFVHLFVSIRHLKMPGINLSQKTRKTVHCLFIGSLLVCIPLTWVDKKYKFRRLVMQQSEMELQEAEDLTPRSRFYLPVYRLADACIEVKRQKRIYDSLHENICDFHADSCSYTSPEIVLIIGESNNRSHFALYGYDKATTPHQAKWLENGQMITFNNVISPWNTTCEALESMLSLSFEGDTKNWYERPFITSVMKNSGYETCLISNQYVTDKKNSFSDFIEDIFINIPEVSLKQFDHRNKYIHRYDHEMLDEYDSIARIQKASCRFTIFHTHTAHFDFSERYPESFNHFKEDDYDRPDLPPSDKTILASYDNAIRYNDHVVNMILERFNRRDAIVIYAADHGERVFDGDDKYGRSLGFSQNEVRQQHPIPFWIWASPQYIGKRPDIWENIRKASGKRYMTDLLPFTIITLAGIHTNIYHPRLDLLSEEYDDMRPRIIRKKKDYDRIVTEK